jgi:hypothetical protein
MDEGWRNQKHICFGQFIFRRCGHEQRSKLGFFFQCNLLCLCLVGFNIDYNVVDGDATFVGFVKFLCMVWLVDSYFLWNIALEGNGKWKNGHWVTGFWWGTLRDLQ